MSTTCEVLFEPLALDVSNYSSWRSNVLISLKVLSPTAEVIMVASILPKDETCVSLRACSLPWDSIGPK
jgi:hypothetical protein